MGGLVSLTQYSFSPAVFRDLANTGRSDLLGRAIIDAQPLIESFSDRTVSDYFDLAFSWISPDGQRNDYVYRNAVVTNVGMGVHSLNTAVVLNEMRAVSSKADVVIVNGKLTAYEIKSERDTLGRLGSQIVDYRRVFSSVNVIAHERHVDSVVGEVPSDVGILMLSRRGSIATIRGAIDCPQRVVVSDLADSLQTAELKRILVRLGIQVPEVPNTLIRRAIMESLEGVDTVAFQRVATLVLKDCRSQASLKAFLTQVPRSTRAGILALRPDTAAQSQIYDALRTPLIEASTWG